jgi:RimJ/RimL family protein N-acetyltransferase
MSVLLRFLEDADLDQLFKWGAIHMRLRWRPLPEPDPSDRAAFDTHCQRIRNDPDVTLRAIDDDAGLVGMVASFTMEGEREVSYWGFP